MKRYRLLSLLTSLAAVTSVALVAAGSALAAAPPAPTSPDLVDASDSGVSASDEITNDSTPDFLVNAGVGQAGLTVTLHLAEIGQGPTAVGTATVDAGGFATVTASSTPDETYDVTATTKNGIGEESNHSLSLEIKIDTTPPTILGPPFLLASGDGQFTFTQTPTFTVFVDGDDTSVTVKTYEGAVLLGTGQITEVFNFGSLGDQSAADVVTSTPLSDGVHTVHAIASDIAGNDSLMSASTTIEIDGTPPVIGAPDLLPADDSGANSSDDVTKNPRPRFAFATEPSVRVILYEDGIAIGGGRADAAGTATIRVNDLNWFDPGVHCVYAMAIDGVGHTSRETPELCLTIEEGGVPFASNLGVDLQGGFLALSLRSTVAARATIRVLANGKRVSFRIGKKRAAKISRRLRAGKRKTVKLRISKRLARHAKIRVVANVKSKDGRRIVVKKRALAKRAR